MKIRGALQTPDGQWRVEVVQQGASTWYRILRDGQLFQDKAAIGSVEFFLTREGVSMADMVEAPIGSAART